MEKWKFYIAYSLIALTGVLVLCTVFEGDRSLVNGLVMGKLFWAQRVIPFFCLAVLPAALFNRGSRVSLSVADIALLLFMGITHLSYDRTLNPEPDKLLFEGQLLLLWFALRVALSIYPRLKTFFMVMLLCIGAVEAVTGLQQLYGMQGSNHYLFRLTGSFYNPGPYSGFLAMLLPLAVCLTLKTKKGAERKGWYFYKTLHYFPWLVIALILIVLPAGMSRTAWIATLIASAWVYWIQEMGIRKSRKWINSHKKTAIASAMIILVLVSTLATGVFMLKKDSANGRLLLWKITARAMTEQPVGGTGTGGFPAAYAKQQAAYFASGKASDTEAIVAGAPEYAFNEFLQIGVERGAAGLAVFLVFIGFTIHAGIRNRQYGVAGGILALSIFSLASYPLQLPEFAVAFIFLAAIAVTGRKSRKTTNALYILIPALILSFVIYHIQQDRADYYRQWSKTQQLYNNKVYETALPHYETLYPSLRHKPGFLFEMGQCQSKTARYDEAINTLRRASQLSADPMIHYMIAKNEQLRGNYEDAESTLLHAINILPERIYPYYLLVHLYNEPAFQHPEKRKAAADAVLTKEPKVESTAIRQMREEVGKVLRE